MLLVDIKKRLGGFRLNVAFETAGETLALLGASGCGKSMTLKCIAGIVRPDSGHIELNGRVLFDSKRHIDLPPQKRRVGYLFQQYALFPHMTTAQNISAGACHLPKMQRRETVARLAKRFHLEGLEDRYPHQLSGGQQQRLALARILAGQPELLLLDEPFSALDSYLKWQLELELMDTLADFGGDVIFVSHDRNEVCRLCQSICVLTEGSSEPVAPVHTLMAAPGSISAAVLSGCKNYSRAVRVDEHTVNCADWGVTLRTAAEVRPEISAAGVRAHHLQPGTGAENNIPCTVVRVIEDVFSTIIMLTAPGGGMLRLEMEKERWTALGAPEKLTVHVAPEQVMVLTGDLQCMT